MHRPRIDAEYLTASLKTSRILTFGKIHARSLLGAALVTWLNTYELATTIPNRKDKHFAPQLKLGQLLARWRLKITLQMRPVAEKKPGKKSHAHRCNLFSVRKAPESTRVCLSRGSQTQTDLSRPARPWSNPPQKLSQSGY